MNERIIIKEVELVDVNLKLTLYKRGANFYAQAYKIVTKATYPKPVFHYYFTTEVKMNEYVSKYLENLRHNLKAKHQHKAEKQAQRKAFINPAKIGDKFVACWGYDQTQYSIYKVVSIKGKFVSVEGLNSWSNLGESDLAVGSKVKIYSFKQWDSLTLAEKQDLTDRHFDFNSYTYHYRKEAQEKAQVRTITDVKRINGEAYTYIWTLDNGDIIRSDDNYKLNRSIQIIAGVKRCLVSSGYGDKPYIKIDSCITAYLDTDYNENKENYIKQNEYTAHHGR